MKGLNWNGMRWLEMENCELNLEMVYINKIYIQQNKDVCIHIKQTLKLNTIENKSLCLTMYFSIIQ